MQIEQRGGDPGRWMVDERAELQSVLARMDARLEDLARSADDRRIFLSVYRTMTGAIAAGLGDGRFVDPGWTAALTARFAMLYFEAEDERRATGRCAGPWEAAFSAVGRPRVSAIEHALLGINAHIVYDLPRAVAATMRASGDVLEGEITPGRLARRRHDYEVVNHILAETIDDAQAVLARYSRMSWWLDVIALQFDEYAAEMLLRVSRTQGWHTAVAMAVARTEAEQEAVRSHLERVACGYVARIDLTRLVPGRTARGLVARFREPFGPVAVGARATVRTKRDAGRVLHEH